jgi:Flp pilus assembly pilin Flp
MLKNLIRLVKDEEGITAMEYGLLAAAIAGVLILVAFFFSNRLGNAINNVSAHIN